MASTAFSEAQGFGEPIIVDNIDPAQAETELRNLARQDVDVITVGAGEISEPLASLTEEFPDIFWYCNCGAGTADNPGLAQTGDDSSEISYTAGYATGLLLQDTDKTSAAFLGCCDLDFEKEAFLAFQLGLQAVDPAFTVTYIPTGDFNDVAGATEAFNNAIAEGAGAVYPFLGGSHEAVVQLANDADVITMSAGTSDACERTDLDYQIAVQFDAGDYLETIFDQILTGQLRGRRPLRLPCRRVREGRGQVLRCHAGTGGGAEGGARADRRRRVRRPSSPRSRARPTAAVDRLDRRVDAGASAVLRARPGQALRRGAWRATASTSICAPARSTGCSGRTAPASRR